MTIEVVPVTLRQAQNFVALHHRHHLPPRGQKFSIGIERDAELVGVVIVGRPIARHYDDGYTAEVTRSCVLPNIPNGNSMLYGAAWRAAKAMGYRRLITYTQAGESGASLRAAGWSVLAERSPRKSWADSTVDARLAAMRDPAGPGGIQRTLWSVS